MEKEEQKQYLIDIMKADEELGLYEEKLTPKERAKNYMRLKKGYKENEIDTNTTRKNK